MGRIRLIKRWDFVVLDMVLGILGGRCIGVGYGLFFIWSDFFFLGDFWASYSRVRRVGWFIRNFNIVLCGCFRFIDFGRIGWVFRWRVLSWG